jgi:hypothetical protein
MLHLRCPLKVDKVKGTESTTASARVLLGKLISFLMFDLKVVSQMPRLAADVHGGDPSAKHPAWQLIRA